ncbi:MAG: hypothetical protein NTY41_06005 [Proteobacteria bacterium]|nr:hypothetical protein [Pseudomonadota bacterium]
MEDARGHWPVALLPALAETLKLSQAEVYEAPSFYHHFDVIQDDQSVPPAVTLRVCPTACALAGGQVLRITSRRGSLEVLARPDQAIPRGAIFIAFAYHEAAANLLTNPQLDPAGKIPEFKFCAVKVEAGEVKLEAG